MFDLLVHAHHFSLLPAAPPDKDSDGFVPTAGFAPFPCAPTIQPHVDMHTHSLLTFVCLRSFASLLRDRWKVRVGGGDGFMAEDMFKDYKVSRPGPARVRE